MAGLKRLPRTDKKVQEQIMDLLKKNPDGLTRNKIGLKLGLHFQRVIDNINTLYQEGWITKDFFADVGTVFGRPAPVYVINKNGN